MPPNQPIVPATAIAPNTSRLFPNKLNDRLLVGLGDGVLGATGGDGLTEPLTGGGTIACVASVLGGGGG
ncbi:MAG: hypothetical protein U7123_00020 [Potamolinea sp.]